MRELANCQANNETLETLRALAQMIRDASDCAVGYEAAQVTLDALDIFPEEVEAHLVGHSCTQGMGQSVPCETLCPAHVNVPGYIALVGEGRYADAIKLIRKDNPFPTACALVCEHPCEKRCRRILIDAPLNIRGIKKWQSIRLLRILFPRPDVCPIPVSELQLLGVAPPVLPAPIMRH